MKMHCHLRYAVVPNFIILLIRNLMWLYLTQFYVFYQKRVTPKCTAHEQWRFFKVVLYLEMLSPSWATTVPNTMLVSAKAHSCSIGVSSGSISAFVCYCMSHDSQRNLIQWIVSLRKRAYSNIFKFTIKNWRCSDKKFWYFSYFCSKQF